MTKTISKGEFEALHVQFISLVKNPANRKPVVYKSEDGKSAHFELDVRIARKDSATASSKAKIWGVVYEPGVVDTQNDWATPEVIERAAHEFLKQGLVRMVDFQHDFNPGKGTIVQSFILNGTDDRFPGAVKGAWCVGIEPDASLTDEQMKEIGGLSLAGQGIYKSVTDSIPPSPLARASEHVSGKPMARALSTTA